MEQWRAETPHSRALGNTQQAGKCAVLHMAPAAINLSLLKKVPYTQLIFCCFQMRSLQASAIFFFYSLPSERDKFLQQFGFYV